MKLLVTGATGLIGSSVVEQALKNNMEVHYLTTQKNKLNTISGAKGFYWHPKNQEIDLKEIKNALQCQGNLSFGSPEYLYEKLGVKPGSVSPYALVNNNDKDVSFYLDISILEFELCNFHPLDNTKTIQVKTDDCLEFLKSLCEVKLINLKTKEVSIA